MFKYLFIISSLLFSLSANALVMGNADVINLCMSVVKLNGTANGSPIPILSTPALSLAGTGTSGQPKYKALYLDRSSFVTATDQFGPYIDGTAPGTTAYTVPANKKTYVFCSCGYNSNGTYSLNGQLVTSTAAVASGATTAPAGVLYEGGHRDTITIAHEFQATFGCIPHSSVAPTVGTYLSWQEPGGGGGGQASQYLVVLEQ